MKTIVKLFNYAYRCGKTDSQRGSRNAHANMRFALFEPVKHYEKETGAKVDWSWFEYFYQSGFADFRSGKLNFSDHLKKCFAEYSTEGGKSND